MLTENHVQSEFFETGGFRLFS